MQTAFACGQGSGLAASPRHLRLALLSLATQIPSVPPLLWAVECRIRIRPDRILVAELRSDETYDYLRNVNSDHPVSILNVRASSAILAFEHLTLLVKESPGGLVIQTFITICQWVFAP